MNKKRQAKCEAIKSRIETIKDGLQNLIYEEREAFDKHPESLQGSEKGERMQECINSLEYAIINLEGCISELGIAIYFNLVF